MHVSIEGNADERGTEEYNLHLSMRRATTVEKYLEKLGASSAQLKAIGYGFERPLRKEHDEERRRRIACAGLHPSEGKPKN